MAEKLERTTGGIGILEGLREAAHEEWTGRAEHRTPSFVRLISRAARTVECVTGELNPAFIDNQAEVVKVIEQKLRAGATFSFVFHKPGVKSPEEASASVSAENQKLVELKRRYPSQVHLYSVSRRPVQQYTVVDSQHVLHEEPRHPAGTRPATVARYDDPVWGEEWHRTFERYVQTKGQEIN